MQKRLDNVLIIVFIFILTGYSTNYVKAKAGYVWDEKVVNSNIEEINQRVMKGMLYCYEVAVQSQNEHDGYTKVDFTFELRPVKKEIVSGRIIMFKKLRR